MMTLVLASNLLLDRPAIDSLLFSVALAVGLTPELLPAIISITMAAGARRRAKNSVIVRRIAAIENLGSVDTLCIDKTGTLTCGVVELSAAVGPEGKGSADVFDLAPINAYLKTGIENPLGTAIVHAATRPKLALRYMPRIDEIPYDFLHNQLTIVVDMADKAKHLVVTKGAFDAVLSCCTTVAIDDGDHSSRTGLLCAHSFCIVRVLMSKVWSSIWWRRAKIAFKEGPMTLRANQPAT